MKVECLLKNPQRDIDKLGLETLIANYSNYLICNKFPPILVGKEDAISMIKYLKRKEQTEKEQVIGPWKNITVFEAANRIASDLVILNGILQMFNEGKIKDDSLITIHLGTSHKQGEGDIIINGEHGEAFNVAPSFFKVKLRNTIIKWQSENSNSPKLTYIFVNSDVATDKDVDNLLKNKSIQLIKVKDWDKEIV